MLFLLTCASVFITEGLAETQNAATGELEIHWQIAAGLRMVAALMAILFTHEMGHYLACRAYGIDATLPFFIPAPLVNPLFGTFGAVIRIKSPFPHRRALFDVGLAGPLAGFAVCVPVLLLAMHEARVVPAATASGIELGDPLFFSLAFSLLRGAPPEGHTIVIGPLGRAAWFGLFVTGLNLLPVGQLDGGHALYALFRERAHQVARAVWWICVSLIVLAGPSWILWAVLARFVIGIRHPPTLDDDQPLGRGRVVVALITLVVFAGCFLPQPVPFSWMDAWQGLREWLVAHHWLTSS